MFHFISFALTIGQGKYIREVKSGKSLGILFSIFCGNLDLGSLLLKVFVHDVFLFVKRSILYIYR